MTELDKAIETLKREYKKALASSYVYNPIGYALYKTWRQFDRKKDKYNGFKRV